MVSGPSLLWEIVCQIIIVFMKNMVKNWCNILKNSFNTESFLRNVRKIYHTLNYYINAVKK